MSSMLPSTLTVRRTCAGGDLDEVRGDAHDPADALVPAHDHPCRAEPAADVDRKRVLEMGAGGQVAQRVVDACAADDRQAVDVLEIRADGLGDAGADPVVLLARA